MTIQIGDKLPNATVINMTKEGPVELKISDLAAGKKILIFAVPGAYTPTCTQSHLPGYVDNAPKFYAKGIDAIYCICVNDAFVAGTWGEMIGADKQDIRILADSASEFTSKVGMQFSAPPAGLYERSKRYALIAEDGVVTALEVEENPGLCQLSSAETMLELA